MSDHEPDARWLWTTEAARLLGVAPATLRRWADAGLVACARTAGGHRRFPSAIIARRAASMRKEARSTMPDVAGRGASLMALSAPERRARARIGGFARAAKYDGAEMVKPARAAFDERFRREVLEAAGVRGEDLSEAEVERRTLAALRAYMALLAFRSVRARSRKRRGEGRVEA